MAYNNYGYPSYGSYFHQQSQQPAQESTPSNNQGYQDQRNIPYSPYYHSSSTSYAQQSPNDQQSQYQSTSYQTTPVTDSTGYNQTYYHRQPYQPKPSAGNVASPYAQSSPYGSINQSGQSSQLSTVDRGGVSGQYSAGQNTSSATAYRDTSALGHLAYASTIGRNSPSGEPKGKTPSQVHTPTPTSLPSYSTTSSSTAYDNQQRPASIGKDSTSTSQQFKAPSQRTTYQDVNAQSHQYNRQLSNPSQFRVTYPAHVRLGSGSESTQTRYPSPLPGGVSKPPGPQTTSASVSPRTTSSTIRQQTIKSPPIGASNRSPALNSSKQNQSINRVISTSNTGATQPSRPIERPQSQAPERIDASQNAAQTYQQTPIDRPTTVDPSQVFDQAEYQRRKVAAEAEAEAARRAVKEASLKTQEAAQKAQQALQPSQQNLPHPQAPDQQVSAQTHQPASPPAQAPKQSPVDSQWREQVRAEMTAMIEKMREWKAKDPVVFTEIWEELRKIQQPQVTRTSSQTPQISKATISSATGVDAAASPSLDNAPFQSPLLGASSPSLNDTTNLPDLGKFPAMRRRTRVDKGVKRPRDGPSGKADGVNVKKHSHNTASSEVNTPPLSAQFTSHSNPSSTDDATGSESMRQAMRAFHNTPTSAPSDTSPPPFNKPAVGRGTSKATSTTPTSLIAKPPLPQNGTAWPEKEKPKLAAVAKSALEAYPANKERPFEPARFILFLMAILVILNCVRYSATEISLSTGLNLLELFLPPFQSATIFSSHRRRSSRSRGSELDRKRMALNRLPTTGRQAPHPVLQSRRFSRVILHKAKTRLFTSFLFDKTL